MKKLGQEPPLVLTRGVWAGGQKHGVVLWSSDIWYAMQLRNCTMRYNGAMYAVTAPCIEETFIYVVSIALVLVVLL